MKGVADEMAVSGDNNHGGYDKALLVEESYLLLLFSTVV